MRLFRDSLAFHLLIGAAVALTFVPTPLPAQSAAESTISAPTSPTPTPPVADPISSSAKILDEAASRIRDVAATLDKPPAPKEDWLLWPSEPVPIGKFATFKIARDLTDVRWFAFARSTTLPDPAMLVDTNGVDALVETSTNGRYVVQAFGLRGGSTVHLMAEFEVGTITPPPLPPDPTPGPVPPAPQPPAPVDAIARAYFVFVDHWNDRDNSPELQALGPGAKEWADMRAAGHKVLILDAESETARENYQSHLGNGPVLLVFDLDQKGPSGGPKFIGPTPVKTIGEVRAAYKKTTGQELP